MAFVKCVQSLGKPSRKKSLLFSLDVRADKPDRYPDPDVLARGQPSPRPAHLRPRSDPWLLEEGLW
jgi:hypothetical protein